MSNWLDLQGQREIEEITQSSQWGRTFPDYQQEERRTWRKKFLFLNMPFIPPQLHFLTHWGKQFQGKCFRSFGL